MDVACFRGHMDVPPLPNKAILNFSSMKNMIYRFFPINEAVQYLYLQDKAVISFG